MIIWKYLNTTWTRSDNSTRSNMDYSLEVFQYRMIFKGSSSRSWMWLWALLAEFIGWSNRSILKLKKLICWWWMRLIN